MPKKINRRELLKLAFAGGVATILPGCGSRRSQASNPETVPRFEAALPIPPVLEPTRSNESGDYYEMETRESTAAILPGKQTTIYGYNGIFPGPTIKATRGRTTHIRFTTKLPTPVVTHLHGGHTPSDSDGWPEDVIVSTGDRVPESSMQMGHTGYAGRIGEAVAPKYEHNYTYPNDRRAATLWYHDHAMGATGQNVYMGLAGFYLVEDTEQRSLPLPTGRYDIPLMLCVRQFNNDGSLLYNPHGHAGADGEVMLVNGAAWPVLRVERRSYRLRILNASNATTFTLALSSERPFVQIATDGGLMARPREALRIPMAMAERVEVVIDFSVYAAGDSVVLRNTEKYGPMGEIMRFEITGPALTDHCHLPDHLSVIETLTPEMAVRTRTFTFGPRPELKSHFPPIYWAINGKRFDPEHAQVNPRLGDVEIWRFVYEKNPWKQTHPPHVHLVNFQILDRNGRAPHDHERGWKDTFRLDPGDDVRVIMRFDGYRGRYLMHCHNLEHEDYDMMMRFDVV
jgi:FtsP/CotA-like multicopper oxidase with cupredoxin domain